MVLGPNSEFDDAQFASTSCDALYGIWDERIEKIEEKFQYGDAL